MEIKEFTETLTNPAIKLDEMKPIVLGLYCYRQMSDKFEYYMNKVLLKREYAEELYDESLWTEITGYENDDFIEENIEIDNNIRIEYREINKAKYSEEYHKIKVFANNYLHYFIEPEFLFSELTFKLNREQEIYEDLSKAFQNISEVLVEYTEVYNAIEEENESLDKLNIFQNINLKIFEDKKEILYNLIRNLNELDFNMEDNTKLIANYEYLTYFFAKNTKTSDNIPTVPSISKLIAKLVAPYIDMYSHVYDPTFGIGSIFIEILKETRNPSENVLPTLSTYNASTAIHDELFIIANEINQTTYNEAIMNLIIHNIPYYDFDIENTDTLNNPKEHNHYFSVITADLPSNLKYQGDIEKLLKDPRYEHFKKLSKRNTDYLFIIDMLSNLSKNGILVTTISPQTLFAEGIELNTRKELIESCHIEAIIKLAPINYNTSTEPLLLIIKEHETEDILFIDASQEFVKNGRLNELSEENIAKITETYHNRTEIEKFSHIATLEEIIENNYNLTTKMYVDNFEQTKIDVEKTKKEIIEVRNKLLKNDKELKEFFKDKENIFEF